MIFDEKTESHFQFFYFFFSKVLQTFVRYAIMNYTIHKANRRTYNMTHPYSDIIDLPHHVSSTRPHMTMLERAAQFAPFAALTGYDAAIRETERLTTDRIALGEDAIAELNRKLKILADSIADAPEIAITYFQPDAKKSGGEYVTATGCVKRIDEYERIIIMVNGKKIPVDEIFAIDGVE